MFHGSIVALVTPMDSEGQIDLAAWRELLHWHLAHGSDGIVVAGTTGESATLTSTEFATLLTTAVTEVGGKIPVLAGTGSCATQQTVTNTRLAAELKADGALIVTPYYNRPSQAGLEAHYRKVASAVDIPIVLYNVPTRTGVDLLPATVARLSQVTNIVALKEANTSPGRLSQLLQCTPAAFALLSGDDPSCAASIAAGAAGVISVAANAAPAAMAQLCRLARTSGDPARKTLEQRLQPLFELASLGGNPTGIKWCLWQSKRIQRGIRLPLTWLAREEEDNALALYRAIEDLVT